MWLGDHKQASDFGQNHDGCTNYCADSATNSAPGDVRYFDPPEATLAGALIGGRTPALAALDLAPACPPN